jgi:amphi-Trp domain-containing protein
MSHNEISYKTATDLRSAAAWLRELASALDAGRVCLGSGDERIVLEPTEATRLKVEAEQKGNRAELSIKLSWREDAEVGGGVRLAIGSADPSAAPDACPTS